MTKNNLSVGAVAVGLATLGALLFLADWRSEPPVDMRLAADFSFTWEGKTRRLSDLRGRVVVLNFWATWCPPCVEEMASLERLYRKLRDRGVVVLGVSVDDDQASYEKFLRDFQLSFPNHRDATKQIADRYGTYMFPETYIIGPEGRVARKVIGPHQWDSPEILFYLTQLAGTNTGRP